jgi:hypothetical protein
MVERYRLMMQEANEGQDVTHQQAMQSIADRNKSGSMKHVIGILGDQNISLDQKKKLMNFVQTTDFKEEPSVVLQSQALAADNKGEDLRGEAARISTADVMGEMQMERENRQKLMNGFLASLPDANAGLVGDMAAAEVLPFGRNAIAANVAQSVNKKVGVPTSLGQWVKNFLLPGSTKANLQEKLMSIPPQNREAYTKSLLSGIKDSASVFHNENYYAQYSTAVNLLDAPTHSDGQVWTENMMTVLDALWVGSELRAAKMGIAGGAKAAEFANATTAAKESETLRLGYNGKTSAAPQAVAKDGLDEIIARSNKPSMPPREAAQVQKQIAKLESERASLLGEAGNLAGKGDVARMSDELKALNANKPDASEAAINALAKELQATKKLKYKDAKQEASRQIQDQVVEFEGRVGNLSNQIGNNRNASVVSQQIDSLDKQINALKKGAVDSPGVMNPIAESLQRIKLNSVVRRENPASPYSIVEQVNPAQARQMHAAIVNGSDEVAEVLTGVNREQAIANNIYPQVGTTSGNVLNKVNQEVVEALQNTGATRYTANEFEQAVSTVQRDFRNATNLEINDAMTTFRVDGDHIAIDAHYSTAGGSFDNVEAAREQAKFALRDYGIRDDEIVIMKKKGLDYVPVEGGEGAGDYIVKVKTNHPINDSQIENWNPLDVKRNFVDRIGQLTSEKYGSASGNLFDPGSMLHPTLTGSASIVTDQAVNFENILLKPIKELRSEFASFGSQRMAKLNEYIVEANVKGMKHDPLTLAARGFNQAEINSLKKWNDIWDGHYYLENYDLVRTLNNQGFQVLEANGTKLFGRNVSKNQNIGKVYDPSIDDVAVLTKAEMDDLYNKGGSYAVLRRPVDINGTMVEHMIVRNTPTEYLRKVRDTDAVLNYREGYYTVNYKAPKFIDEIHTDPSGKVTRKTVAVAGNTADADMFVKSQTQASGIRHEVREDSRGFKKDGDGYWDLNEASGRIAQRRRGKPLTDAKGVNQLGSGSFVENPMESAVRAAKSLSGRSVSRPVLETAKKRFMEQYGDMLPPNSIGGKDYPKNISEIVDHVSHTSSKVADARTTYGYIEFLENGYINMADEAFKAGMNVIADTLGKFHLSTGERAARAVGDLAPTNVGKATVFQAYIAMSNPIRQWIVQSHQAGRMIAYNPKGFLNGGWGSRMAGYLQVSAGVGTPSKAAKEFHKFVTDSGMVAGVDRNSLVRGLGLSMADSSSGVKRATGAVMSVPQTVGFDIGEKVNMMGHLASVHEKYTRQGIDLLNKTNRDLAYTEARALSYDLNKAGELTYTQSTMAMAVQFLQMPHKALLQATNRKLPLSVRMRLMGWDVIMWGAPVGAVSAMMTAAGADGGDILPDDPEHREMFVDGMEAWALNKAINDLDDSDEETRIDFSALAPNAMDGWARMYTALLDDGFMGMVAASPAGQLFAVDGTNNSRRNGRIPTALKTMGRYFNVIDEVDPDQPTEFATVLNDVAKITSGWTAADNALIMLETRKKMDGQGVTVDSSVTTPEVAAAFLGFGTKSTKELYEISKSRTAAKKQHDEEVMRKYRDIVSYYKQELSKDNPDVAHIQKVTSMLMRTFDQPYDRNLVQQQWKRDLEGKEQALLEMMFKHTTMPSRKSMEDDIRKMPVSEEVKSQMMNRYRSVNQIRENNEEGN